MIKTRVKLVCATHRLCSCMWAHHQRAFAFIWVRKRSSWSSSTLRSETPRTQGVQAFDTTAIQECRNNGSKAALEMYVDAIRYTHTFRNIRCSHADIYGRSTTSERFLLLILATDEDTTWYVVSREPRVGGRRHIKCATFRPKEHNVHDHQKGTGDVGRQRKPQEQRHRNAE